MRKSYIALITLTGLFASQVQAECSSNLPYEQLMDCIVVEGSGENYPQNANAKENEVFDYTETEQQEQSTPAKNVAQTEK